MTSTPKILLMRLFEQTSQRGNRYFTGRLGSAKLIAFEATDVPDDQRYGAEVVWNVYLQGEENPPRQELPTRGRSTWKATELPDTEPGF